MAPGSCSAARAGSAKPVFTTGGTTSCYPGGPCRSCTYCRVWSPARQRLCEFSNAVTKQEMLTRLYTDHLRSTQLWTFNSKRGPSGYRPREGSRSSLRQYSSFNSKLKKNTHERCLISLQSAGLLFCTICYESLLSDEGPCPAVSGLLSMTPFTDLRAI